MVTNTRMCESVRAIHSMRTTAHTLFLKPGEVAARALYLVNNFGWLRAPELGRFLSPGTDNSRKYAERMLRKLTAMRYVLPRKLPGQHAGTAYVVTARGAAWLRNHAVDDAAAITYRDGTNWGRSQNGTWSPPPIWQHQVYVAGVLSLLYERGYEVVSELELLRMAAGAKKHADGVAIGRDEDGDEFSIWIEVEQSRKTGKNLDEMLEAVVGAARGQPVTEYPTLPPVRAAFIAVPTRSFDERGYNIDHKARILSKIKRRGLASGVNFEIVGMLKEGVGVCLLDFETMDLPAMPPAMAPEANRSLSRVSPADLR